MFDVHDRAIISVFVANRYASGFFRIKVNVSVCWRVMQCTRIEVVAVVVLNYRLSARTDAIRREPANHSAGMRCSIGELAMWSMLFAIFQCSMQNSIPKRAHVIRM